MLIDREGANPVGGIIQLLLVQLPPCLPRALRVFRAVPGDRQVSRLIGGKGFRVDSVAGEAGLRSTKGSEPECSEEQVSSEWI